VGHLRTDHKVDAASTSASRECLKNPKFGQLVLSEIIKIAATLCQILRQNYAPNPIFPDPSTPPDRLAGFKGPGAEEVEGSGLPPPLGNPEYATDCDCVMN